MKYPCPHSNYSNIDSRAVRQSGLLSSDIQHGISKVHENETSKLN